MRRDDYTHSESFRPIALLFTLGEIMEKLIATRISYVAEFGLLPAMHMGGRKLIFLENAVHVLVEAICATWRSNAYYVVSLLMLVVKGAFNNFSHEDLPHNLRKRGIQPRAIS